MSNISSANTANGLPEMIRDTILKILKKTTQDLIELHSLCDQLYDNLCDLIALDPESGQHRSNRELESGTAIGTIWAAMCIKDFIRTKRFYDGIVTAVKEKLINEPDQPIHIIYAGTGPFATLALPLFFTFSEKHIRFTMIEVNENSFALMKETIRKLGFSNLIHEYINEDASGLIMSAGKKDLLLCEIIQRALKNEPQVPILLNLAPQMSKGFTLIPEEIRLDLAVSNSHLRMERKLGRSEIPDFKTIRNLLVINKETVIEYQRKGFPEVETRITSEMLDSFPQLEIQTNIRVFGENVIQHDESAITLPEPVKHNRNGIINGIFQYQLQGRPQMIFEER